MTTMSVCLFNALAASFLMSFLRKDYQYKQKDKNFSLFKKTFISLSPKFSDWTVPLVSITWGHDGEVCWVLSKVLQHVSAPVYILIQPHAGYWCQTSDSHLSADYWVLFTHVTIIWFWSLRTQTCHLNLYLKISIIFGFGIKMHETASFDLSDMHFSSTKTTMWSKCS